MLFDPTERNVDPFLIPTRARTMKELVLALAIHDKNVTMAKPARVSLIVGKDLPFHLKGAWVPKLTGTMSSVSLRSPNSGSSSRCQPTHDLHPRQIFRFTAVGTFPSAHHGFIRGAIALHTLASSGHHRSPIHGPIAGPRPYAYEQVHEE